METQATESAAESAPVDNGAYSSDDLQIDTSTEHTETETSVEPGGTVSFDQLESLEFAQDNKAKADVKAEAEKEVAKEKAKEDLEAEKKEEKPEADKEQSSEQDDDEKAVDEAKEEKAEDKESVRARERTTKAYKVELDGKPVKLPADLKLKHKVDGEDVEVTLQDALNKWSGHEAVDRRFAHLNTERQKFVEQQRAVDNTINNIFELAQAGKPKEALLGFFQSLGVEPVQAMGTLQKQLMDEAQKLAGMSEAEREAYEAKQEAQTYKTQYESVMGQQRAEAQQRELSGQITQLQQAHNVNDETFDRVAEELLALKADGRIDQQITPELIIQTAVYDRQMDEAEQLLESINPDVLLEQNIDQVVQMMQAGVGIDDIRQFAHTKWGETNPAEVLSKKVQKTSGSDAVTTPVNPAKADVWSFDQIDY